MAYCDDLRVSTMAIRQVFHPDHVNIELLGNVEPHLHFHIIPRYQDDPRWMKPIWTTDLREMKRVVLAECDYAGDVDKLREALHSLRLSR